MTGAMPTHDLLLALAGRVDDDLLTWARELVAAGADERAMALLAATLITDRARLPGHVRAALVAAGRAARTVLDVDAALPPAQEEAGTSHVFTADPPGGDATEQRIGDVLHELLGRIADDDVHCRTSLTWRLTPAGSATGPLPQPVILVELDGAASADADVLAYEFGTALERACVAASVEVFSSTAELPEYHRAARLAGRPMDLGPAAPSLPIPESDPVRPEPAPPEPEPATPAVSAVVSAWWAAADSLPATNSTAESPVVRGPAGDDPLGGPLREPLLAPLLGLTIDENDPLGVDNLFTSRNVGSGGFDPVPREFGTPPVGETSPTPGDEPELIGRQPGPATATGAYPVRDGGPATASLPYPIPREPESVNGRAPMRDRPPPIRGPEPSRQDPHPPTGQPGPFPDRLGPTSDRPGPDPREFAPTPRPRPGPRPDPEPATPVHGEVLVDPRLGLRPDSLDRLSPTDRALLARLQDEMGLRTPQNPARPAPRRPPNDPPRQHPIRTDPPDIAG